jgi:hypothetical protein
MSDQKVNNDLTSAAHLIAPTINFGNPNKVMVITPDRTVELYDDKGDIYLKITPDGFFYKDDVVEVGDAAERFCSWVEEVCNITGGK